ncbi:hypothetical protein L596_013372 [Steinernema carpocapsae]|uniref:Uncharacterized protein n=1 Tax=Steinernema carpocapsae TaxID=34508 RepID=A0A4U5NZY9_STECR|nr:hypothetical protein L596_013372 [Steinernema carpocapsae]
MTCMFTLEELEAGALFVPSWLESNSRVRNVVMKSLNSKRRRIRSDKAKNALTESISVISMFGEPMDDPFLKGLFDEHERDSLLDPFDQIKIRELAQLVHTQIGRICLDEEDSKAPKSRKRTGEDVNEKMEKCTLGGSSASGQSSSLKSFGSRKEVQYTFFPCVFQALLRKIKQNLIKELDRPFLKDLLVAFGRILELLPPTNRINRESWMRLFTGTPTEPYDSSKGYEWRR